MTKDELLEELTGIQTAIDECTAGTPPLYARRVELVEAGRELGLTVREMAAASGAKEGALRQALHQARAS